MKTEAAPEMSRPEWVRSSQDPRTLRNLTLSSSILALILGGCAQYAPFDSVGSVRAQATQRLGDGSEVRVPFELDAEVLAVLAERYKPHPNELRRVEQVLDLIFGRVGLKYSLVPTRSAVETFRAAEGNCLSFVNLFVGIARRMRLNPFYVEVTDYSRWSYRDGQVVSQGHIVAGMFVRGELKTYDFLPYRSKSYRSFQPIDDLTATAHFYNNLGAEALMAGDLETARHNLEVAQKVAPSFVKAINNLGVLLGRYGRFEEARETFLRGLAIEPEDVALVTNLASVDVRLGRADEARELFTRIEGMNNSNPYFFLYQGESALAAGDLEKAGRLMAEALRRDTESPEVHVGLVKFYLASGDLVRARHHLGRALKLDATHQEALRYAAMLDRGAPSQ